jgi:hypothetical protein
MTNRRFLHQAMTQTQILRPPKHHLATYGTTVFDYVLLCPLSEPAGTTRLREGRVTAQRPHILTPELWKKRFEGFGEETELYQGAMDSLFGEALRALEYTFKNALEKTTIEHRPVLELADRIKSVMDQEDAPRAVLLQSPDTVWGLAVMKFIVEMTLRSFPVNLRELEEHDAFDPHKREETRARRHIETLFKEAAANPALIEKLGHTLKASGRFAEYEDRFFALVRNN